MNSFFKNEYLEFNTVVKLKQWLTVSLETLDTKLDTLSIEVGETLTETQSEIRKGRNLHSVDSRVPFTLCL